MPVEITLRESIALVFSSHLNNIEELSEKLLDVLQSQDLELSVLFTDDQEIAQLNKHYREKDRPTDVLSFSINELEESPGAEKILGDVVISIETAEKQAQDLGYSLFEEVARLLIHGTLHLKGYEHEGVSVEVAEKMRLKEQELFAMLVP